MTDALARFLDDLVPQGITDSRVHDAIATVDRRRFLPDVPEDWVYEDGVLPDGRHHSQPLTVARLCSLSAIGPDDRVLEVGTGSGYQAAVLVHLGAASVITIECDAAWADQARARLGELPEVRVVIGDGRAGWVEGAPYDVVVVNAAAPEPPRALLEQVGPTGRLVMPIGDVDGQVWQVWERASTTEWETTSHGPVQFTALV